MSEWIRWAVGLIIAAIVTVVLWLINFERRMNLKVDREEYERDVKEGHHELMECLKTINERGEKRDEYMHQFKHDINDTLHNINLKLALVTREQDRRRKDDE